MEKWTDEQMFFLREVAGIHSDIRSGRCLWCGSPIKGYKHYPGCSYVKAVKLLKEMGEWDDKR